MVADQRHPVDRFTGVTAGRQQLLGVLRVITERATGPSVPAWARDMTVLVLEEMGELEAARVLVGGLLESGRLQDPHEARFLDGKLRELEAKSVEKSSDPTRK